MDESNPDTKGAVDDFVQVLFKELHKRRGRIDILDAAFEAYVRSAYGGMDKESAQYQQLEVAYYAGMQQFFSLMAMASEHLDEDAATEFLDQLHDELHKKFEAINARHGKQQKQNQKQTGEETH